VFFPAKLNFLKTILPEIADHYDYQMVEIGGEADHIHVILQVSPTDSISVAVARLKSVSAKLFLNRFGSQFWGKHRRTLWNSGYFVSSVGGVTLDVLKHYVESQGRG
jgi:putative transposase